MMLLRTAFDMVKKAGWHMVNLDCVVCCEEPKLLPYRDSIRQSLGDALEVPIGRIFVKGKTGEGLGPVGKGKAAEAIAVCLLNNEAVNEGQ